MKSSSYTLTHEEFRCKLDSARKLLSAMSLNLKINDNGSYCHPKGTEISNFFIRPISVSTQYAPNGLKMDDIYEFELLNRCHCSKVTISLTELSNPKWIKTAGGCFSLSKSANYHHILALLGEMPDSCYDASPGFGCTGFHKIGGCWCYAASNLVIYADKLDWGQHMLHEDCHACRADCSQCRYRLNSSLDGVDVPKANRIQDTIIRLITGLHINASTSLPIFMTNILSGVSSVLSSGGLSCTPLTLWITGEPGCGKTQLALYLGSFYCKPDKRNDPMFTQNYLRANESTRHIRERILKSRDNTVILDDVKSEDSKSLGEHKNTNIDTLVRSIYDHNLSGLPVYSNAIITGEYRPNGGSTLARMVLLPLKSFQESPENLETLCFFQNNGYLLTDFIILFLQWVCHQLEDADFLPTLQNEKIRYTKHYIGEGFSARSSEVLTTLRLGLYLLENFCCTHTLPSFKETISALIAEGETRFMELVRHTSYLHEDSSVLYAKILYNMILKNEGITKAAEVWYKGTLNHFNYCVSDTENGIFIENPSVLSRIPYFQKPSNCQPCLLIREDTLKMFQYELEGYCMRHNIPSDVYKEFKFSDLADLGFINVACNRSDGYANHLVKYPSVKLRNTNCHISEICLDSFFCINLKHPLLKKMLRNLSNKTARKLSIFRECTDEEYETNYAYDEEPGTVPTACCAEDINKGRYTHFKNSILHNYMADFQNIFDYRFTKN